MSELLYLTSAPPPRCREHVVSHRTAPDYR